MRPVYRAVDRLNSEYTVFTTTLHAVLWPGTNNVVRAQKSIVFAPTLAVRLGRKKKVENINIVPVDSEKSRNNGL